MEAPEMTNDKPEMVKLTVMRATPLAGPPLVRGTEIRLVKHEIHKLLEASPHAKAMRNDKAIKVADESANWHGYLSYRDLERMVNADAKRKRDQAIEPDETRKRQSGSGSGSASAGS